MPSELRKYLGTNRMPSSERRNVVLLKQQLADALGEQGKSYWTKLSEFLRGECSKQELDTLASIVITTHQQCFWFSYS